MTESMINQPSASSSSWSEEKVQTPKATLVANPKGNQPKKNNNWNPKPKEVKVPIKVNPSAVTQVEYSVSDSSLKESFTFSIAGGPFPVQMTVHRPIGVTDYPDDCWVITDSSDIPTLLARKVDPSEGDLSRFRNKFINEELVKSGLLVFIDNRLFYPKGVCDQAHDRNHILSQADAEAAAKRKKLKDEYKLQHPGVKEHVLNKVHFPVDRDEFLNMKYSQHEKVIYQHKVDKKLEALAKAAYPQSYRTKSGVYADKAQIPFCKAKSKDEAFTTFMKSFKTVIDEGQTMIQKEFMDGKIAKAVPVDLTGSAKGKT